MVAGALEELRAAFLAADRIIQRGRSTFLDPDDPTFRNSGAYLVIQVAEAAKRLPEHYREQHPGVDWKSLVGLRGRAAHYAITYDFRHVWETITQDFARLSAELELNE